MLNNYPWVLFWKHEKRRQLTFDMGEKIWSCWDNAFPGPTWGATLGTPNHQNHCPLICSCFLFPSPFHQLLDILVSAQKRVACPSREVLEKNHAELDPKKHENEIERKSEIAASSAAGITTNQYLDEY